MGVTTLLTAVPAFFVAYFLQILVIIVGASPEGAKLLPVFVTRFLEPLVRDRPLSRERRSRRRPKAVGQFECIPFRIRGPRPPRQGGA